MNEIFLNKLFHFLLLLLWLFSHQSGPSICNPMGWSTPGLPVPHHLLEFAQVHVHCISDAIQAISSSSDILFSFCPQSFPALGTFPMSQLFVSDDQNIGVSASVSVLPTSKYSGLISLKIDCFDVFVVQQTLRSLLQHHSSKASILWHFAFFTVQGSHPYMTTGKTIALTIRTFVYLCVVVVI